MPNSAIVGILRALLTANTAEFETAMARAADTAKIFSKDLRSVGAQASQVGASLTKTITLPLVGLGAGVAKLAMDFESSFAGVRKTVQATEAQFAEMAQGFRTLSKTIPVNVNELNRLGEAAGALGIPREEIVEFARVMAELGVTTNLTADDAADATARIQNIFGAAGKDTERFASTLVALGNAGASTEREIVEMAQRIAGAGHTVGLTQAQVLAMASSLASVGINAEAGGSAISRIFLKMNDAVMAGGEGLREFARVAGVSAQEFKQAFEQDAAGAVVMFVNGLNRLKGEGENINGTIEGLIGKNIILKDTLLRLAGAGDLMADNLKLSAQAWRDNTALTKEAETRFQTTANQLTLLWNRVKDVGITIGNALLPGIRSMTQFLGAALPYIEMVAQAFAAIPGPLQAVIIGAGALVAAAGPAIFVFGQLTLAVSAVTGAFAANGIATRALSGSLAFLEVQLPTLTAGFRFLGTQVALTNTQVEALGLTMRALGGIVATVGAALAGWTLGRMIAETFDLDNKIANLVARIRGLGDVQKETAGAKQDTINRAIKLGAAATITYADAVTFLNEAYQAMQESQAAAAAGTEQFVGPLQDVAGQNRTLASTLAGARKEIAALSASARNDLATAIRSGAFEMKELEQSSGLSETALKLFKEQLEETDRAQKAATDSAKKFRESVTNLTSSSVGAAQGFGMIGRLMPDLSAQTGNLAERASILDSALDETKNSVESLQRGGRFASAAIAQMGVTIGRLPGVMDPANTAVAAFRRELAETASTGQQLADALRGSLGRIPDILKAAFTGGGGIMGAVKAILVDLGSQIGQILASSLSRSLSSAFANIRLGGGAGVGIGEQAATVGGSFAASALSGGGGAAAAAGIGSTIATAGITLGISAGVMGGIALFKKLHKAEWEKLSYDVGRDMGVKISDGLAKAMEDDSKKFGRQVAMALHLDEIIAEGGGVNAGNVDKWTRKLRDVFSFIETGQMSVAQAAATIDKNWASMVEAGTDRFGFLSDGLRELIELDRRFGTQSKEIAAYLKSQADIAIKGTSAAIAVLGPQITRWEDLATKIAEAKKEGKDYSGLLAEQAGLARANRQQLEDLGTVALSTFAAAMAAGASFSEALQAAGPGLQQLAAAFDALGISTENAALNALMLQSQLLERNPALIQGISGLGQSFAALSNMGMLNVDTFRAMERTGLQMYSRLQGEVAATGGSTRDALLPMQDYLHRAEKAARELGVPLDENTQRLIDQSKELGIWQDVGESAADRQEKGIKDLTSAIEKLTKALLGIPDVDYTVTETRRTEYETSGPPNNDPPTQPAGAWTGGIVQALGRMQRFAGGGMVAAMLASGMVAPNMRDSVPVWTMPGEVILNEGQKGTIGDTLRSAVELARTVGATQRGGGDDAILAELRAIRQAIGLDRYTSVDIDGREVVRASHRVYSDNVDGLRTDGRELLLGTS